MATAVARAGEIPSANGKIPAVRDSREFVRKGPGSLDNPPAETATFWRTFGAEREEAAEGYSGLESVFGAVK